MTKSLGMGIRTSTSGRLVRMFFFIGKFQIHMFFFSIAGAYLRPRAILDMVFMAPQILQGSPNLLKSQWWELFMEPGVGEPTTQVEVDSVLRRWFRMMYLRRKMRLFHL